MAAIKIKRVNGKTHSEDIYHLQAECFPTDTPCLADVGYWWLAYDDDKPVAFGLLSPSRRWKNCGFLARAGVLKSYRGQGLQKRLIKGRVKYAKALGWTHVFTDTTDNVYSSNNLVACGFKMYKPSTPWSFKNALYFRIKF